jgi:hypothetical protein
LVCIDSRCATERPNTHRYGAFVAEFHRSEHGAPDRHLSTQMTGKWVPPIDDSCDPPGRKRPRVTRRDRPQIGQSRE